MERHFNIAENRESGRLAIRAFVWMVAAAVLVLLRLVLSEHLPPVFGHSDSDEFWFVNAADFLRQGKWLGDYDQYTLIKGCFGPMVLALSQRVGMSFLHALTLLHIAACVFFTFVASRFSRNRLFLLAAFAFLLFQPLSFACDTFQRVYRNGMSVWQVPLVLGAFGMLPLRSRGPVLRLLLWAFMAGGVLWALLNTREDGIWVAPFALVCVALAAARAWRAENGRRSRILRAAVCLTPLALVLAGNAALCAVNGRVYGLPMRNDRDAGNYAKAMRDLYLIRPNPVDEARLSTPEHAGHYHNVTYDTLCQAYDASPTLRRARPEIDDKLAGWGRGLGEHGRDLYVDHILFALRDGLRDAGLYRSLPETEAFFADVHRELSEAFADGRLKRRGVSFTAMAAPFRWRCVPRVLREWRGALVEIARSCGARAELVDPAKFTRLTARPHMLRAFEGMSGLRMVAPKDWPEVRPFIDRANAVAAVHEAAMPWLLLLALAAHAATGIRFFRSREYTARLRDGWLLATGVLGCLLVHSACIAYMSATTFWATIPDYLAPSIEAAALFIVLAAAVAVGAARESRLLKAS